jgi:hypothetical protein
MNLIPRTIPNLLMMSEISFETPNNFSFHHNNPFIITILATLNLKWVALCVREYADMIETTLQSIINRGIVDIHIDSLWLVGANRSGCRRQIPHSCIGGSADWHQRRREETYGREPRSSSRVRGNI